MMTDTNESMFERIAEQLDDNPNESHVAIAERLGVTNRSVRLVCKDISLGKPCQHGKPKPIVSKANPGEKQRQASINISDADWGKFKEKHASAAARLGELVREDIK